MFGRGFGQSVQKFGYLPQPTDDSIIVARDRPREEAIAVAAQDFADQLSARVRAHPEFWYHFYGYWNAQRQASDPPG